MLKKIIYSYYNTFNNFKFNKLLIPIKQVSLCLIYNGVPILLIYKRIAYYNVPSAFFTCFVEKSSFYYLFTIRKETKRNDT